jgi:hypothetical protein
MATTPVKTVQTPLVAWRDVTSASQFISSTFSVATCWAGAVGISLGRQTGTAFTAGWPNVRIEASKESSPNNASWIPIFPYTMGIGSTALVATTLNGAVAASASTFVVTSATSISVGKILFLGDTSTSNYELCRVKLVSGSTVTPEANLAHAHANGAVVSNEAEMTFPDIDFKSYTQLRAIVDNANSGQSISAEVTLITLDSLS